LPAQAYLSGQATRFLRQEARPMPAATIEPSSWEY
jgi:hypothetical protein